MLMCASFDAVPYMKRVRIHDQPFKSKTPTDFCCFLTAVKGALCVHPANTTGGCHNASVVEAALQLKKARKRRGATKTDSSFFSRRSFRDSRRRKKSECEQQRDLLGALGIMAVTRLVEWEVDTTAVGFDAHDNA